MTGNLALGLASGVILLLFFSVGRALGRKFRAIKLVNGLCVGVVVLASLFVILERRGVVFVRSANGRPGVTSAIRNAWEWGSEAVDRKILFKSENRDGEESTFEFELSDWSDETVETEENDEQVR